MVKEHQVGVGNAFGLGHAREWTGLGLQLWNSASSYQVAPAPANAVDPGGVGKHISLYGGTHSSARNLTKEKPK